MNNYPFKDWVPKPLGVAVLLVLFIPLFFSGGTYLSNINEMVGSMGVLAEDCQFLNSCAGIGMAMVFPFMLPYLQGRNVKHVYVGGFALLAGLNWLCARTQSLPLLAVCCFFIGFIRVMLTLNTTFAIAPYAVGIRTLDMFLHEPATPAEERLNNRMRTFLMPVLYGYILLIVQLSNYVSAWVAYAFRWSYTYYLVVGLLLTALLLVLLTFCEAPTGKYRLPFRLAPDALLLVGTMAAFCYLMTYGKTYDWLDHPRIRLALGLLLVCGGLLLGLTARRRYPLLESATFGHRYVAYSIGIFLLLMLINSSTLFVTTYLKLATPADNYVSAGVSGWAMAGCLLGLLVSVVCVWRGLHLRYFFALGFLFMLSANLYLYFHYQTAGAYNHIILPTLLHYTGMLMLYSVTCAFAMKRLPVRCFATWLFLMVAVRNVIAPAIGTSVYGNRMQERQQYYVTRLAANVRSDNPMASPTMAQMVYRQATLVAMKDITGSTVWIGIGSAALVLLLPYYKGEET